MDEEKVRAKRSRVFERHAKAAHAGVHLPSFNELLRGMEMFGGRLVTDAGEFAMRVLLRLKNANLLDTSLAAALRVLTVSSEADDFLQAGQAFAAHPRSRRVPERYLEEGKLRCDYYAACKGDQDAMLRVARHAMNETTYNYSFEDIALETGLAALGWLCLAVRPTSRPHNGHREASGAGATAFERMLREHERQSQNFLSESLKQSADQYKTEAKVDEATDAANSNQAAGKKNLSVVVIETLGNADINHGSDVQREFKALVGTPLPLCPKPDLRTTETSLNREFPHAHAITSRIVMWLSDRDHVRLRPLLLVGPPGSGKTTYAQRLLQELGVANEIFPCGGINDSALMGTARRWSSGEPSVPLSLIRRYNTASPGVVLDELEKAGSSRHNGSLHDCLLGMLEPQSAITWRDPYIQAPVDLSHVVWIGTANDRAGIPVTLLDRMTAIDFPVPGSEHLHVLANSMLKRTFVARGYDQRWATPLDCEELTSLFQAWPGGSLRALQRFVEAIIDARNSGLSRQ